MPKHKPLSINKFIGAYHMVYTKEVQIAAYKIYLDRYAKSHHYGEFRNKEAWLADQISKLDK